LLASIGNDIVDLQAARKQHPRFAARILSSAEQVAISNNKEQIWLYWAAKEAAYKALKRIFPETIFSPNKFELDPKNNLIRYKGKKLFCRYQITTEYISVECAVHNNLDQLKSYIALKDEYSSNESEAVRELALTSIASFSNIPQVELEICSVVI